MPLRGHRPLTYLHSYPDSSVRAPSQWPELLLKSLPPPRPSSRPASPGCVLLVRLRVWCSVADLAWDCWSASGSLVVAITPSSGAICRLIGHGGVGRRSGLVVCWVRAHALALRACLHFSCFGAWQPSSQSTRTGGAGSVRRKKKTAHKSNNNDDKKLQGVLKKLQANAVTSVEEANLFLENDTVIHFDAPKVQACIGAHTFVISGRAETKRKLVVPALRTCSPCARAAECWALRFPEVSFNSSGLLHFERAFVEVDASGQAPCKWSHSPERLSGCGS